MKWHNSEKTEYDYLTKKVTDPTGRDFLEEVNKTMAAEADNNSSVCLKDNFSKYKIYKIEEFEKIEDIEKTEEIQ